MATLVLTMIGDDRPGLVDALSGAVAAHGGNWDRSHLAQLAGKFAGIVVVTVADTSTQPLLDDLARLRSQGVLDITATVARGDRVATPDRGSVPDTQPHLATGRRVSLHLVGADRPGIVHEVSAVLASHDVSIVEFESSTASAPMAGESLFEATATLIVPPSLTLDVLQSMLEDLANELMVDIALDAVLLDTSPDTTSPTTLDTGSD